MKIKISHSLKKVILMVLALLQSASVGLTIREYFSNDKNINYFALSMAIVIIIIHTLVLYCLKSEEEELAEFSKDETKANLRTRAAKANKKANDAEAEEIKSAILKQGLQKKLEKNFEKVFDENDFDEEVG